MRSRIRQRVERIGFSWQTAARAAAGATKARERSDSGDCVCVNDCIIDVGCCYGERVKL